MSTEQAGKAAPLDLGRRVRALRNASGWTITAVAQRAGMSHSAISKIENGQLSPTYDTLLKLAQGLQIDIATMFRDPAGNVAGGRRAITRKGAGEVFETRNYRYEMLCTELVNKRMVPLKAVLHAHEEREFGKLVSHAGEELIVVLRGRVELRTEFYAPIVLSEGDCAYFDSTMGHACLAAGPEEAEIFWVSAGIDEIFLPIPREREIQTP